MGGAHRVGQTGLAPRCAGQVQVPDRRRQRPGRVRERVGGRAQERRAALPRVQQRCGAGGARGVHDRAALPDLRRQAAQGGEPGGAGERHQHRRRGRAAGGARGGVLRERAAPLQRPAGTRSRDRGADPQGSGRPAPLPPRRRARVPHARPRRDVPVRWRDPAHPPGDADRLPAGRRALHPGRAQRRPAPARQRAAARHPSRTPRPRQHRHRGGARRGHHPVGRSRDRPGPPRGPVRRRGGGRGHGGRHPAAPHIAHRALPPVRAPRADPARTAPGAEGAPAPDRRRQGQQPEESDGGCAAGALRRRDRRLRLGEVARWSPTSSTSRWRATSIGRRSSPARIPASRASTGSTRSSTSIRAPSGARRARTPRPTPDCSRPSASCSPSCRTPSFAVTGRGGSRST